MLRGLLRGRYAALGIDMPAYALACVFHLHGKPAIDSTADQEVVTLGVVAIQAEMGQMYDQGVSWRRSFYVERAGFRIAAEDARDALFVLASRVHGRRVDGVARRDRQDWFIRGGKLAVENGGNEFVALRGSSGTRWNDLGRERVRIWRRGVVGVCKHDGARNGAALKFSSAFFGAVLIVLRQEMNGAVLDGAFEFVAVEIACELVSILFELEWECD